MRFSFGKPLLAGLILVCGLALGTFLMEGNGSRSGAARLGNLDNVRSSGGASRAGNGNSPDRSASFPRLNAASNDELLSLENLARRDHDAAILRLDSLSDPDLRPLALAVIAKGWAEVDPQAAGAWVVALDPEDDSISAALGLIPAWVTVSPERCLGWATSLAVGKLREVSLAQLADAWVSADPQRAVSSYFALKPEPGSERGLHVVVSQWALDAPEAAVDYFMNASTLPRREEFLETALVSLTNKDPAMVWRRATTGFSDPARILNVREMALEAMSETNPRGAIQLAESVGNDPQLLKGIARGWAFTDEAAAKSWINAMADPELVKALMKEIPPP